MKIYSTPWGAPQNQKIIAEGLTWVSTAGHGGLCLSDDRWQEFERTFPTFHGYAGTGFLEEDCDWSAAVILWPNLFEPETVRHAVSMVQNYGSEYMAALKTWLNSPAGEPARTIAKARQDAVSNLWQAGTQGSHHDVEGFRWFASLRRVGDKAEQTRLFRNVCMKDLYTDQELEELSIPMPSRS